MSWRETWRETVESFLREVRDPADPGAAIPAADPVAGAIAGARAELRELERQLEATRARLDGETEAAAMCERRRAQAERIGDADTARVAARFGRRHADRAEVLTRKAAVLGDELALARRSLAELLDLARAESGLSGGMPE